MRPDLQQNIAERLMALEADVAYQEFATADEPEIGYRPGQMRVLVSAPHGARQWREERNKDEDNFTAALALLTGELTGAHVLYTRRRSSGDPNWDRDAPFKQRLAELVRQHQIGFVLDIHGAGSRHTFGLALGTMSGVSCPEQRPAIIAALRRWGFDEESSGLARLDLDHTFTGSGVRGQVTITRFTWETLGIPVAQLEIHASLRIAGWRADASDPQNHFASPPALVNTVNALVDVVKTVGAIS